ncbi:uncharacterized protein LOC141812250 [Curcuma longa]|uniref:uncharacterized protein LOC141812250 n=1 Tax=Curcuma longa TaxID=136217 RepID=UPI003D9DB9CF
MSPSGVHHHLSLGGAVHLGNDRLVIRLPDLNLIRLIARSVLFAATVFFFAAVLQYGDGDRSGDAGASFLPNRLSFLGRRGLLRFQDHDFFLHDASKGGAQALPSDFVISASAGDSERAHLAAVRSGRDPSGSFQTPANYAVDYIGQTGSAAMAAMLKKTTIDGGLRLRRLLSVPVAKKEALSGLEEVLLEPPGPGRRGWRRKARYLPELTGDALDGYPRRVFVEVAPAGASGNGAAWFERNYPTMGRAFEFIHVEVKEEEATAEAEPEAGTPSLAEWLERNVKEEEYVVVKADATAVEEVVGEGSIGLVDELFLECDHQTGETEEDEAKKGRRRPYWECLALYGKLRDAGVAVHQWWSF